MSEIEKQPANSPNDPPALTPEQIAEQDARLEKAREFLRREVPILGKLTGLNVHFQVGEGWATDMKTGNFTIDPSFFVEKGYSPEHSVYATLHELWAHVRDVKRDPQMAARQIAFGKKGGAQHMFSNIMADIHGNKLMHNVLPRMKDVAAELYSTKLFPTVEEDGTPVDYSQRPLHIQFLYAIIRDEMIPGSETSVRPEVAEALEELRNYKDTGEDAIRYLTDPNNGLTGTQRFDQQQAVIYPIYKRLLEQAKEEREQEQQQGEGEGEQGEGEQGEGQEDDQQKSQDKQQPGKGQRSGHSDPFEDDYEDYRQNVHPEPMTPEEHEEFEKAIKEAAREHAKNRKPIDPKRELDKQLRQETGHSLTEHQSYEARVDKYRGAIERMREVWRSVINERVAEKRGLSRRAHNEGVILDPDRLAQTVIDVRSNNLEPEAFKRYEKRRSRTEIVGNTDYFFFFDRSSSMNGGNEILAADSALIMLEAMAGVERDVKKMEEQSGLDLDLSLRTACYTFGDHGESGVQCHKELSEKLTDRERLDTYSAVAKPSGGTPTAEALQKLRNIKDDKDRRKIVIVVTDGQPNDVESTRREILHLRDRGWYVYAVSIGSTDAEHLFAPDAKYIATAEQLPDTLEHFIDETVNKG